MNRSLLQGFLAGLALAVIAGLVVLRLRPAPSPERASAAEPAPPAVGRYQLVSSIEVLMLDTATGELWFYRHGKWHRAAGAPRDDGDRGLALGELDGRERGEADPARQAEPVPDSPGAAAEERGRAEVIQVESAPEPPPKPAPRRR